MGALDYVHTSVQKHKTVIVFHTDHYKFYEALECVNVVYMVSLSKLSFTLESKMESTYICTVFYSSFPTESL